MAERYAAGEALGRILDAQRRSLRVATVGRITAYDRPRHTADVRPQISRDGDEPVLPDRPVMVIGGGDGYLAFPHTPGDPGLLIACDEDPGEWRRTSEVTAPAEEASHDLSTTVFFPGLRACADEVPTAAGATILAGGDVRIGTHDGASLAYVLHTQLTAGLNNLILILSTWAAQVDVIAGPLPATAALVGAIANMQAAIGAGTYRSSTVRVER